MKSYTVTFQDSANEGGTDPPPIAFHVRVESPDIALDLARKARWPSGAQIRDYEHEGWCQAEVFDGHEDFSYINFQASIEELSKHRLPHDFPSTLLCAPCTCEAP